MGGPNKKKRIPGSHSSSKSQLTCEGDNLVTWALDMVSPEAAIKDQTKAVSPPSPPSRDNGSNAEDEEASLELGQDFCSAPPRIARGLR